jgi:DNA-binding protein H-NS
MSINELLAQKAELERQIAEQTRAERASAVSQIKTLMFTYGLTPGDIVTDSAKVAKSPVKEKSTPRATVAPKYRDDAGNTWTGRGLKPRWLTTALAAGATLEQFAI